MVDAVSRTRLLRPAFFTDELLSRLPFQTRFIYAGLWTECDDAGYFEWKPAELALALMGHDTPRRRQVRMEQSLAELVATERVRRLECEVHGVIPTLPEHGVIKGGNHAYGIKDSHEKRCLLTLFRRREAPMTREYVTSTDTSTDVSKTGHVSGSVSVSGSGSDSGRGAPRDSESPAKKAAAAAGGFISFNPAPKPSTRKSA